LIEHLFIYGTLVPGRPNGHVLADLRGLWQMASVRGHLVQEGWGAQMGYPAFRPGDDGETIFGVVISSPDLHLKWPELDTFEGPGYRRIGVDAHIAGNAILPAQIYAISE
jgi:gamma-glutamylcyclotransferase (GGCT)/AIG2-like uncharacterized protein YtfP